MEEVNVEWVNVMERLIASVDKLTATHEERVGAIVATVESEREADLARRLADAEARIAELAAAASGRKTVGTMLAKHSDASRETAAIDGALASLSVEQRFAVKAELLRAGVIG